MFFKKIWIPKRIQEKLLRAGVDTNFNAIYTFGLNESATFICMDAANNEYWVSRDRKKVFIVNHG